MGEKNFWGRVVVVSLILALGGFGYILMFSPFLGGVNLSPNDSEQGLQYSPAESCREICIDGRFAGCQKTFEDLACGLTCKGVISSGQDRGKLPVPGNTPCEIAHCVCG